MAGLVIRRRRVRRRQRQREANRLICIRTNVPFLEMSNDTIFARFRFSRDTILFLVYILTPFLGTAITKRNSPITSEIQILVTLRFLATGAFHSLLGDVCGMSVQSCGRCITRVCNALAQIAPHFIKMPRERPTIDATKAKFYRLAKFPNVIGCVDGTFIRILCPRDNENDFLCRKGFYALNVQMICDADFRILDCVANWPGSLHDSRIFRQSAICNNFENGLHDGILLGDSGYASKRYLVTPFLNPVNATQEVYNKSHCRTRVVIEQTFGILKKRFNCLHSGLRVEPVKACRIIVAAAVLHNIGIMRGDIIQPEDIVVQEDDVTTLNVGRGDGNGVRNYIANTFFSRN